ncbi:MAG: type II secretion system F family protein [Candidatus Thermoplasmatota archaeon]|nr:type II secretion system F family protein [Candidatus Thermoplasmatota archaeon]
MVKKKEKTDKKKREFIDDFKIAYRILEDKKKFYSSVLAPLVLMGILIMSLPFILQFLLPVPVNFHPATFIFGGIIPIILGVLHPYISYKNKATEIDGNMHFFITHLRVLAISDLSLKDILNVLGGKKVYKSLGSEIKKVSVLSTQWRYPMASTLHFIALRTPSKILKDFLDRFSQSLDSGVEHREFIETEQKAVMQDYKTMYETSNENIVILNEVYVSMLIAIIFVMSFGIVLPMIMGAESMTMYTYLSSFMLIVSEILLLYLLKSIIPDDVIWHQTGEKSELQKKLTRWLINSMLFSIILGIVLAYGKYSLQVSVFVDLPMELLVAISLTPLVFVGIKTFIEEDNIARKEKNFLGFLTGLGSIATMKGGKITESVYYLSKKDYGILTRYIRSLYRRLRTRIDDGSAWQWFGVDTNSNFIQRSCEMFREATYAAANPTRVTRMIAENMRKILDLRKKKFSIVNTTTALFGGITFGISFAIYVSFVISRHLNEIVLETGDPFSDLEGINIGTLLYTVPPETFNFILIIIFLVLIVHSFILAYTIKVIRGSHLYLTFLYFIPFVWVVAITSFVVDLYIKGMLTGG